MTLDLENTIGIVGAILSSLSFLPQVVKIWRTKSADDLSMPTILLLAANALTWMAYGLLKDAKPLAITNALMLSMLLLIIFFKIKFRANRR
jgi:MtN3 and saliva related transmembrane protein